MALTVDYTGFVGVGSWNYYKATAAGSLNTLMFDVCQTRMNEMARLIDWWIPREFCPLFLTC